MARLASVAFVLLVGATFAAFFAAQRIKGAPPVVQVRGMDRYFSPNGDGVRDAIRFDLLLRESNEVSVDVVDGAGEAVRRLADGATVAASRPLPLRWDGRTDAGDRAPDGVYRVRVTLRDEGRSVTVPRTMQIDTEPPRPYVRRIAPDPIVGPDPAGTRIYVGRVSDKHPTRVRILRMDSGAATGSPRPRAVAELRIPAGEHSVEWDGRVAGGPAPPGTYLVEVTVRDRAGNVGSEPAELPPGPGDPRGRPGLTVRTIAAAPPLRPVTAGEKVTINVDARRRPYRWRLRRAGGNRPVARGREAAGKPVVVAAPRGDSGLYLLELRAGAHTTAVPLLVQSRDRARMLVVVPATAWVGAGEVDEDADGVPDTLAAGASVTWPRVFPHGLPDELVDDVAPVLVWLDRNGIRYDLSSDLDLAMSRNPRASDRKGVLLVGSQRWVTRPYARRLRRYVAGGGLLASIGTDSLRRGVTILHNREGARGKLVRPTQPAPDDAFGTRVAESRRVPADAALTPIGGDPANELLTGFDGALTGFRALEESEPPARGKGRLVVALGIETAPAVEEGGVPEELPPARAAFAATRIGSGLMIRVGLPEWGQRINDPEVSQLTRNIVDVLRGAKPRIR